MKMNWQVVNEATGNVVGLTSRLSDAEAMCARVNKIYRDDNFGVYEYNGGAQMDGTPPQAAVHNWRGVAA